MKRIVFPKLQLEIHLDERPIVLAIENNRYFRECIGDLWNQSLGNNGEITYAVEGHIVKFSKGAELIVNPFAIDLNGKKILSAIYSEAFNTAKETFISEINAINTQIIDFLDLIVSKIPAPLNFSLDMDLKNIFKSYDLKVETEYGSLLEQLVSFIKLNHRICGKELFVFVNLKQYFNNREIEALYKECKYEHIMIIDIEGHDYDRKIEKEKYYIVDEDLCIIECE